jgi:hypothetical protein
MRIAEGVGSKWLGCSKRFLRAELNISEARHGEGQLGSKSEELYLKLCLFAKQSVTYKGQSLLTAPPAQISQP